MLFLWYGSILAALMTLAFGLSRRSPKYVVISAILFLPFSYYFLGFPVAIRYIGLLPIAILLLAIIMKRKRMSKAAV